jgi:polyferredoxin
MFTRVIQISKMQTDSSWKTIRWTRLAWVIIPIALLLASPIWYGWINPTAYAEVRCVIQDLDGSVAKGFSESECLDNGKKTFVLRANQPLKIISPAI